MLLSEMTSRSLECVSQQVQSLPAPLIADLRGTNLLSVRTLSFLHHCPCSGKPGQLGNGPILKPERLCTRPKPLEAQRLWDANKAPPAAPGFLGKHPNSGSPVQSPSNLSWCLHPPAWRDSSRVLPPQSCCIMHVCTDSCVHSSCILTLIQTNL